MLDLIALCTLFVHAASSACDGTDRPTEEASRGSDLRLFGVEIGGPEDGFSLTDRSAYESAQRAGARSVDLRPIWSTLEPEPGVYDWSGLDAALANAAAVGLPVTVTVRFFDDQVPKWLDEETMLDQDGLPFSGYGFKGVHRSPSYWEGSVEMVVLVLLAQHQVRHTLDFSRY